MPVLGRYFRAPLTLSKSLEKGEKSWLLASHSERSCRHPTCGLSVTAHVSSPVFCRSKPSYFSRTGLILWLSTPLPCPLRRGLGVVCRSLCWCPSPACTIGRTTRPLAPLPGRCSAGGITNPAIALPRAS